MADRANEEELAQLMSIALDNLDVKPDSTATAPRTVRITRGRDGYAVRIGDGAGSPKVSTKTNADQFFARGAQPYTLCSFFSVLCSCLSQPLAPGSPAISAPRTSSRRSRTDTLTPVGAG